MQFDGSADTDLTNRYLFGPAVDQILASEDVTSLGSAGNTVWALWDHLGTPRDIADQNEGTYTTTVTNHRTYDSFGKRTAETNSAVDLLFGFVGKSFDEDTGLANYVNRWYDPQVGQWLSEDPIQFDGADENVRRYVFNNPLSNVDPLGLATELVVTIWGAEYAYSYYDPSIGGMNATPKAESQSAVIDLGEGTPKLIEYDWMTKSPWNETPDDIIKRIRSELEEDKKHEAKRRMFGPFGPPVEPVYDDKFRWRQYYWKDGITRDDWWLSFHPFKKVPTPKDPINMGIIVPFPLGPMKPK